MAIDRSMTTVRTNNPQTAAAGDVIGAERAGVPVGLIVEEVAALATPEGTAVLSTGEVGGTKFLREDGDGTSSWQAIAGGGAFSADAATQITPTTPIVLDEATGNEIALNLAYTVNKASSGNDTGLVVNQTDTASPGTSNLAEFQVGGTPKLTIDNTGMVNGFQFTYTATDNYGIGTGALDSVTASSGLKNVAFGTIAVRSLSLTGLATNRDMGTLCVNGLQSIIANGYITASG